MATYKLKWKWDKYTAAKAPWIKITATAKGDTAETLLLNWQKADGTPTAETGVTVAGSFASGTPTVGQLTLTLGDTFQAGATFHKWVLEAGKATDAASADKLIADDQAKDPNDRDKSLQKLESSVDGKPTAIIQMPDDSGTDAPFTINGLSVLGFERQTGTTGASLDAATFRSTMVSYLEQVNGLGASGSADRTSAYTDFLGLWKNDVEGPAWKEKTQNASSCAITIRSIWRLMGLRAKGTTSFDAPYQDNKIFDALKSIAKGAGALTDFSDADRASGATFLPHKGDVVFIQTKDGSHPHVFICVDDAADASAATFNLGSIDGGQTQMTAQPWPPSRGLPTAKDNPSALALADEPCEGIWRRKRVFTRAGLTMNPEAQAGGKPASLDAGKIITSWIDVSKMQTLFTYDMVKPVRKSLTEFQTT